MKAEEIKKELSLCGIAPVIVIDDADDAVDTAKALLKGGVWFMEVTFRTAAAAEAIRRVAENVPEMIVGAGTVINVENAKKAVDAGAKFIVTPGYVPEVVDWCNENEVAIVPGTQTMTEICWAINAGCDLVKLFPAVDAGGVKYMKSINSVFPFLKFMPSGGIGLNNFEEFASYPGVAAATGSWLAPRNLIKEHRYEEITEICRRSVLQMHGFRLLHIGINNKDEQSAYASAKILADLLSEPLSDKGTAFFVGSMADVVKYDTLPGPHGHIAIECTNVDRAVRYFEDRGYRFTEVGKGEDEKGLIAIWFDEDQVDVGGFAVHLRRRD
jgi:2-dehydro-3-deoxyphosphogluconate aldolase/(4S)-4-hydroxy-2-oxoglutarate aldolase